MTKSPDDEYMEQLESENAALKAELKAINAALDDPRTDLTLTAVEVIVALKEQVARLEDLNRKLCDKTNTLTIQSARLEETITLLQSKSAALVDALEGLLSLDEENHQRYPGDEDVCLEVRNARAALAEFKGAK